MARFQDPFEDTQALYTEVINAAGLAQYVHITVLVDNKAKKLFEVVKANKILNHRTGDDVIIIINEGILEKLTPEQRKIVIEESVTCVSYDSESDTLAINKPDVVTHSGILSKYTFKKWDEIRLLVKEIYKQEEDAKEEAKNASRTSKSKKSFAN